MEWYQWLGVVLGILGIPGLVSHWIRIFKKHRWLITAFGLVLIVVALILIFCLQPQIKITSPVNEAIVPLEIMVEGYSTKELKENQHLYMVVEHHGEWWPQVGEIVVGYSQTTKRYEFTTINKVGLEYDHNVKFIIRALLVDSAVHQHLQNWFQQGTLTGEWQWISPVEAKQWGSVKICDTIKVTRQ